MGTEIFLLYFTAGIVLTLFAGLALWVALARRPHWFLRSAVLLCAIALLLPIDAYDAVIHVLLQSALIIAAVVTVRTGWPRIQRTLGRSADKISLPDNSVKKRTTVRDLLLATTLIAVVVALATAAAAHFPMSLWDVIVQPVVVTTLVALTAALAVATASTKGWRVLSGIVFIAITALGCWDTARSGYYYSNLYDGFITVSTYEGVVVATYATFTILILALCRCDLRARSKHQFDEAVANPKQKPSVWSVSRFARPVLITLIVLIAFPLGWLYWRMATPPTIPQLRSEEPNGYNGLMAIARKRKLDSVVVPSEEDGDKGLNTFAATHATIVDEVRNELVHPSFVPVIYTEDTSLFYCGELRDLARALEAIGRKTRNSGRTQDAIDVFLDTVRLGHVTASDGLLVDYLVGCAIEISALDAVRKMRHALTTQQQNDLLESVILFDDAMGPLEGHVDRDQIWSAHAYGWRGRLYDIIGELSGSDNVIESSMITTRDRRLAQLRLLTVTIAINLYRQDRSELPDNLDQLVPKYLPKVIEDPFGAGPFVYRRQNKQQFILYSLGNNRIDDGGTVVMTSDQSVLIHDAQAGAPLDDAGFDYDQGDYFLDQRDWVVTD